MTARSAAFALAVAAAFLPAAAAGQAICSAPHSSPTLAQSGSLNTMPAGAGWFQVSVYGQRATEFFNPLGNRQPFLAESRFDTRSIFVTGAVGVVPGLEVWAQVPVHRLSVDARSGQSTTRGVGDVRMAARLGTRLVGADLPLAVRVGAKVPGSDFPVDATVLPLTEGQTDVEVSLESGRAVGDGGLYVMGWVGYRWRGANLQAARDPGDERFSHLAVGGSAGDLTWEVGADALWGAAPRAQGVRLSDEGRRLFQVLPTLGYRAGPGRLEATTQLPVWGKNLPAGVGFSLGYRMTWGL